jgi:hypothetical protein
VTRFHPSDSIKDFAMMLRNVLLPLVHPGCAVLVAGCLLSLMPGIADAGRKPVTLSPKLDRDALTVALFDAIESSQIDARLVHRDEKSGNLFIENLTGTTLNIKLPNAFVGVHVLNQAGFDFSQLTQNGQGTQSGSGNSGGQVTGGGAAGNNQNATGLTGGPIFSIPPDRIIRVPVKSVCLEHGKQSPLPRMEYRVAPVEAFSSDPVLREVLTLVARGEIRQQVGQAIAWHLANGKSWKQLAQLRTPQLAGLPGIPVFLQRDVQEAESVLTAVKARVEKEESNIKATSLAASDNDKLTAR